MSASCLAVQATLTPNSRTAPFSSAMTYSPKWLVWIIAARSPVNVARSFSALMIEGENCATIASPSEVMLARSVVEAVPALSRAVTVSRLTMMPAFSALLRSLSMPALPRSRIGIMSAPLRPNNSNAIAVLFGPSANFAKELAIRSSCVFRGSAISSLADRPRDFRASACSEVELCACCRLSCKRSIASARLLASPPVSFAMKPSCWAWVVETPSSAAVRSVLSRGPPSAR